MENKDALLFFENMAKNNPGEKSVKISKNGKSDFSHLDAEFILKFAGENSNILDLASGSGLIINKMHQKVKSITAVEAFSAFSKFIKKADNIFVINADIRDFDTDKQFDLITVFGLVQYFNESEIREIYKKYKKYLAKNGKIIIKNQFGVKENVTIEGFSEELQTNYYSNYRQIEREVQILEQAGYKNAEVFDIYPPECSRWENTHFYAIVASAA